MIRQLLPSPAILEDDENLEDFYAPPPGRHLRADFVVSIDGAVEIDGRARALGAPADRSAFIAMRAVADAVLVGAGTARIERYGPVVLPDEAKRRRKARGQEPVPRLVVVSRRGLLSAEDRMFSNGYRPTVVTTSSALATHESLSVLADVVECGTDEVDLAKAMDLMAERGWQRVLCEGGPTLLSCLLTDDLVDEMCVTFSPVIAGPQHLHLTGDTPLAQPSRFRLQGLLEGDGLLIARYDRDRGDR
ncbi:MAG TPA: pyrimidine reductase family protein [Acidimicrobiales bacterium]|nr:pyrimidine reductase family protein [Acidimicrobiales bacterium]